MLWWDATETDLWQLKQIGWQAETTKFLPNMQWYKIAHRMSLSQGWPYMDKTFVRDSLKWTQVKMIMQADVERWAIHSGIGEMLLLEYLCNLPSTDPAIALLYHAKQQNIPFMLFMDH